MEIKLTKDSVDSRLTVDDKKVIDMSAEEIKNILRLVSDKAISADTCGYQQLYLIRAIESIVEAYYNNLEVGCIEGIEFRSYTMEI